MNSAKPSHNAACQSEEHEKHLCFLTGEGFHFSRKHEYRQLVADARYVCNNCGRTARDPSSLCDPVDL